VPANTSRFYSRANPNKLFSVPDYSTADGLITDYLEFECFRTRVDERFDLRGDVTEHLRIIDWYFSTYLQHRKQKLPISASQAAFLNAPIPVMDLARPISVISFSFIRRELGQHWDLTDLKVAREAIYWWCVERSPVSFLQDALIPEFYADVLNEVDPHGRWEPFHLNYFATRYHQVHPDLHFLNLTKQTDRVGLFAYLILLAAHEPHLVRFLPRDAVGRLLAPLDGNREFNVFDSILALLPSLPKTEDLLGSSDELIDDLDKTVSPRSEQLLTARRFRRRVVQAIESGGYSLRSGRRRVVPDDGGHSALCYHNRSDIKLQTQVVPGIAVIGPFQAGSGLGQASRLSVEVLSKGGWDVTTRNFIMDNPAPVGYSSAIRLDTSVPSRQINLIHLNAESIPLAFAYLNQDSYRNSYNIGYFFWELSKIPACHHLALKMLDEIWVSSEYNREIYSSYTDIPVINVGMAVESLPEPAKLNRGHFGISESGFVFLTTFDSFSFVERKNPLGVIRAFQAAFSDGEDVILIIKTQNRYKVDDAYQNRLWKQIFDSCRLDARITVINETLSYSMLLGLKALCDCYISLHRSEGWGFGMLEAMQLGLPVVATGYSGNMEFCTPSTCYLVDYNLVEPRPEEYIFVERGSKWAEPDTKSAARCMREVFNDRVSARRIAEAAQQFVKSNFSTTAIASRYSSRLEEIIAALKADGDLSTFKSSPGNVESASSVGYSFNGREAMTTPERQIEAGPMLEEKLVSYAGPSPDLAAATSLILKPQKARPARGRRQRV
jgi:glycosyltransferase involved in cell wall biosynthesis